MKNLLILIFLIALSSACSTNSVTGDVVIRNSDGSRTVKTVWIKAYKEKDVKDRVAALKPYFDDIDRCVRFDRPADCEDYKKPMLRETMENFFSNDLRPVASTSTNADGTYKLNLPAEPLYLYAESADAGDMFWVIKLNPGVSKMSFNEQNSMRSIIGIREMAQR